MASNPMEDSMITKAQLLAMLADPTYSPFAIPAPTLEQRRAQALADLKAGR